MNLKSFIWAVPAAILVAGATVLSASPADAAGGRARFDFVPGELAPALTGQGSDTANYYLSYKLTNPMDEARTPRLYVELKTDTGKTYGDRADAKVLSAAGKALKASDLKATSDLRSKDLAKAES